MVRTQKFDLDTDTTLGGNNASDYIAPSQKAIKSYVDNHSGGGGTATDVQINGTSITSNNVANIVTNTAYDASSNKIATMSDIPENEIFIATYGTTFYSEITNAYGDGKAVFVKYVNGIYPLVGVNSNYVSFCGVRGTIVNYITCDSSSVLGWSIASSYTAEQTSNKTTSLSPASTNTQYPSAKCVYDELVDKANVDLSNVSSSITSIPPTSLKNFDGDFHFVYYVSYSSTAGSFSFNLGQVERTVGGVTKEPLNILPEDDYSYLLYVRVEAHKKAKGSIFLGNVANPYNNNETSWTVRVGTVTEGGVDVNDGVILIGTERILYMQNNGGTSGNFQIRGYRRIGTNS